MFSAMDISTSGMVAQRVRLAAISNNIANISTTHNEAGTFDGHLKVVRLPARSLQIHWPEGNVLISGGGSHREPQSNVPDYNAVVTIEVLAEA